MSLEDRNEQLEYEQQRALRRKKMRKKRQREAVLKLALSVFFIVILAVTVVQVRSVILKKSGKPAVKEIILPPKTVKTPPDYDVQLLDVNEYSRPGTPLKKVNGIVVHYTANPGTSAQNNRDYFQGLSVTGETSVSSHFVIGIEGELIQCVPCNEVAYASNDRNSDTISIECCIPDETGKFSDSTYETLVHLTAWLMGRYDLKTEDVIRHYDVTGKNCPKYFVEYPSAWEQFKKDVNSYIEIYGTREVLEDTETSK
ncbi:MAG: N-acetylmuramoyl-L-alanine amidase [Roseburia sp.]|nr:N-acetylmuramoyl-L-alanine amidase [Roseburia sp.]